METQAVLGIKETKEAIVGILELSVVLASVLKDGAQLADVNAFLEAIRNNPEIKAKLQAAQEGASKIPSEVKDIDLKEGLEVAGEVLLYVPRFLDALKKGK